jgi:Fe-coproporphyrin III synthase
MSLPAIVRHGAKAIVHRPGLAAWYVTNRLRLAKLAGEQQRSDGFARFPRSVTFAPTLACNLRCKMCMYVANGAALANPRDSLDLEAWTAIVDDVAKFRPYITLTGGEPTLYPHLPKLIAHIKRRGLFCTMVTNGTLLSKLAGAFEDAPPDVVVVSLDGPAAVHNEIRSQPLAFERAAAGIAALGAIKHGQRWRRPLFAVNCSITAFNQNHLEETVEVAESLGAVGLNFQQQWTFTRGMVAEHNGLYGDVHPVAYGQLGGLDLPPVDVDALVSAVARIKRYARRKECRTYIGFYPDLDEAELRQWYSDPHNWVQRRTPACAWIGAYIWPTGELEACPGAMAGNVTQKPFAEVWNGPVFRGLRQRLARDVAFPICARCCFFCRTD